MDFDVVLRGGTIFDGSGQPGVVGDLAISGQILASVGKVLGRGRIEIDASGLAVAPGFINMLSWAATSLIEDGRSESDLRQGVTLEVLGEGRSMGPLNPRMKRQLQEEQGSIRFPVEWESLGGYLDWLVRRGVSTNIASFVGATSIRVHELGYEDRPPTPDELGRMCALVGRAMEEGAMGLSSALIYAPAFYAATDELVALAKAAALHQGLYISHLRSEGARWLEAIEEFLHIARTAGIDAEIYHLKAAGQANWPKLESAIARIESARAEGLRVTADMYVYTAGATGLDAAMPPWVQEGGYEAWRGRLREASIRGRVQREMNSQDDSWENFYLATGSPENILLSGFRSEPLRRHTGQTLAEVARQRGQSPEETAMDLVIEDGSRVDAVYFLMSEENVRRQLRLPWVSFGSDSASLAPSGVFLKSRPHPRAYGNFARLLGHYVREERIIPLEEAVRRLTTLPAETLKLRDRGRLAPGHCADVAVFDPAQVRDHATYAEPHRFSTGMVHVFVNGIQVLRDGEHTGAKPGQVVRGPGWSPARGA